MGWSGKSANDPILPLLMPTKIARILIAIVAAPAVIAILLEIWAEFVWGHTGGAALLYVIGSYIFGFPIALVAMAILQAAAFLRLWHFIVAGLVAGLLGSLLFLVRWPEASLAFLIIGPIVGAVVWMISEWQLPPIEDT